ncbi:hypothetical protein JTE90_008832, partial [Oedothorax gibbosus]
YLRTCYKKNTMTRYARVGSSQKHQRPPGDATPWEELSRNSKKSSSVKDGKFNRVQKGRIEKNKGKGNKVGNKSFKLPASQPTKYNVAGSPKKQVSKDKSVKLNKSSSEGKLISTDNMSDQKKSSKKRKKKVKNTQKALDYKNAKSVNKILSKNQQKKAWKKKKMEKLKAKQSGQSLNGSDEKNSESRLDKDFLSKKNVVLEKLERKKSLSTPLPSKVERTIFYIKKKLREKGLSQSAIREIVNKERKREEEKFLKTCTTKPCFNCRQIGHLLSNCPLRTDNSSEGTGTCFKCGSSEHMSSKCSKKIQGFPLAKCFVCKEQGHISKDCPKNKHGLYIKGGGCAKCGNVNHLNKDCPSVKKRKVTEEEGGYTLHTINEGTSVDEEILEAAPPKFKKKPNKPKVVKF